jgi:galactan endo-1,6-beta-galactosidase
MWWMLDNHNPSGSNNGASDNLQSWNHQQHCTYLATVAAYAKKNWNVTFDSVDAFNEPASGWWKATGTQEGCHFSPSTQAAVVPLLRETLDAVGLQKTRVSSSDENSYDLALSTWKAFPAASKAAVGQINVHGYQEGSGDRVGLYNAAKEAGKILRNSEYGDGDATGVSLATNLNLDMQYLHPTAWVYWQAFDGGGWGLVDGDNDKKSIGEANPKFHVLAQYTRHIRQGDTIIDGGDGNTVAALSKRDGGKLVLVKLNKAQGAAQPDPLPPRPHSLLPTTTTTIATTTTTLPHGDEEGVEGDAQIKFDLSALQGVKAGAKIVYWVTEPEKKGGERHTRHDDATVNAELAVTVSLAKNAIVTLEVSVHTATLL